jgi:hypothetical protein
MAEEVTEHARGRFVELVVLLHDILKVADVCRAKYHELGLALVAAGHQELRTDLVGSVTSFVQERYEGPLTDAEVDELVGNILVNPFRDDGDDDPDRFSPDARSVN